MLIFEDGVWYTRSVAVRAEKSDPQEGVVHSEQAQCCNASTNHAKLSVRRVARLGCHPRSW